LTNKKGAGWRHIVRNKKKKWNNNSVARHAGMEQDHPNLALACGTEIEKQLQREQVDGQSMPTAGTKQRGVVQVKSARYY